MDIDYLNPIVIDFESYYDKDFGFSKLTTEQYVRDKRFEVIGVSVKDGYQPAQFYREETGIDYIRDLANTYPERPFVAQNTAFDMAVLGWNYNIHPKLTVDTIMLAKLSGLDRVLGGSSLKKLSEWAYEQGFVDKIKGDEVHNMAGVHAADMSETQWVDYGEYCKLDSELCFALYQYLLSFVPLSEVHMASITTRMFTKPVFEIDVPLLEAHLKHLKDSREQMLLALAKKLGFANDTDMLKTLRSTKKFAELLERMGVEVPTKWSDKKQEYVPATSKTDKEFLALLESDDPLVVQVVEAKLGSMSNIEISRTETFLDIASRGRAPIFLRYGAAHTLRYGGGEKTNYQNMPKRTKEPVLRRSLKVPEGGVLIATDSSQIEGRLNAFMASDMDKVQKYIDKVDLYSDMAASIYGCTYNDMMVLKKSDPNTFKARRAIGKEAELGLGYGMSANKFHNRMELTGNTEAMEMAERIVDTYRRVNRPIVDFWYKCNEVLEVMLKGGKIRFGGPDNNLFEADGDSHFHYTRIPSVRLPNGTYIWYQNLRKEKRDDGRENFVYDQFKGRSFEPVWIWGSKLTENLCQALAFAVLKWQALKINDAGIPLHLNVHDEWVSLVPKKYGARAALAHHEAMSMVPEYLPEGLLTCEVDVGLNYADLTQLKFQE